MQEVCVARRPPSYSVHDSPILDVFILFTVGTSVKLLEKVNLKENILRSFLFSFLYLSYFSSNFNLAFFKTYFSLNICVILYPIHDPSSY